MPPPILDKIIKSMLFKLAPNNYCDSKLKQCMIIKFER